MQIVRRIVRRGGLGRYSLGFLVALVALLLIGQVAQPGVAWARTEDARNSCGVDPSTVTETTAVVPDELQDEYFQNVPSVRDPVPIECGNGTTTGAVHIEVKHKIPNWGDGITAIVKTIDKGVANKLKDRTEYTWNFATGKTMQAHQSAYDAEWLTVVDEAEFRRLSNQSLELDRPN